MDEAHKEEKMPATAGKLNLINLSKDGTFRASGEYQTLPHEVDAIFEHARTRSGIW